MSTAPTGKSPEGTLPAFRGTERASGHPRSVLHRILRRVVTFVVPPDDKIAQTWRWLL